MQKSYYEDYKYCIQEISTIYLGTKYTFAELLDDDNVPFKLRAIFEQFICPKADLEDTLETHLYYLEAGSFLVKTYDRLKCKVKINIIEEKRGKKAYTTKVISVSKLVEMSAEEKEKMGVVVAEISFNKLAVATF